MVINEASANVPRVQVFKHSYNRGLFERTVLQHVLGLLVAPVTNVWHGGGALELATAAGVDTLGPTPRSLRARKGFFVIRKFVQFQVSQTRDVP